MTLRDFFGENKRAAIAFSGGVDSALLLWAALDAGADVKAYYVSTPIQPEFEKKDALRLVNELGAKLRILDIDILAVKEAALNGPDRCYHCKKALFGAVCGAAREDGYSLLLDGTNASDDLGDRPGVRAAKELNVVSPLLLCGLTKDEIRRLSKEAGLFTWSKPSYSCLATRVPTGETITKEKLCATERAETYLMALGFSDLRVRYMNGAAKIQVPPADMERLLAHRGEILNELKQYYSAVLLDMEGRP